MNMKRWESIKRISNQVADEPRERWAALLDELCGQDEELRGDVEALLNTEPEDDFLIPPLRFFPPLSNGAS